MSETLNPAALAKVQSIIAEALMVPAASIGANDAIASLPNIDSLSFEMIVVSMESATGKTIDPLQLLPVKTVTDLTKLLQSLES